MLGSLVLVVAGPAVPFIAGGELVLTLPRHSFVVPRASPPSGTLGDNFVVKLTGQQTVAGDVIYSASHSSGVYNVSYLTPSVGTYSMHVALALPSGLYGSYFNNRWLFGTPAFSRTCPCPHAPQGSMLVYSVLVVIVVCVPSKACIVARVLLVCRNSCRCFLRC